MLTLDGLVLRVFAADPGLRQCGRGAAALWLQLVALLRQASGRKVLLGPPGTRARRFADLAMGPADDIEAAFNLLLQQGIISELGDGVYGSPLLETLVCLVDGQADMGIKRKRTPAQVAAARANGAKGGRPRIHPVREVRQTEMLMAGGGAKPRRRVSPDAQLNQTLSDKENLIQLEAAKRWREVAPQVLEAAGLTHTPVSSANILHTWLASGASLELILRVITAMRERLGNRRPMHLGYFSPAISEAMRPGGVVPGEPIRAYRPGSETPEYKAAFAEYLAAFEAFGTHGCVDRLLPAPDPADYVVRAA